MAIPFACDGPTVGYGCTVPLRLPMTTLTIILALDNGGGIFTVCEMTDMMNCETGYGTGCLQQRHELWDVGQGRLQLGLLLWCDVPMQRFPPALSIQARNLVLKFLDLSKEPTRTKLWCRIIDLRNDLSFRSFTFFRFNFLYVYSSTISVCVYYMRYVTV